jgi:exosortase A
MLSALTSWRLVVSTILVTCIGIAPTFVLLWPKWSDSLTYSHGLLIVPLCIWLLWRERDRINAEPIKLTVWAVVPLLAMLFLWSLSFAANIEIGATATMPLILLLAVLLAAGRRIAIRVAFPILLLFSTIPIWDYGNSYLQSMTTSAVAEILGISRVPAFIQGNIVQIPSGSFEIAGGCSGIHFLIVGLTLAAVYGYLYLRSTGKQLLLVGAAFVMSIVMNWIRVATIIIAGHLTNMQSFLVQVDHYYFGWALFVVLLVPFFLFARKLEDSAADAEEDTAVGVSLAPGKASITAVAIVFAIAFLPVLVWGRLVQNEPAPVDVELPNLQGWDGPKQSTSGWQPIFPGADGEAIGIYERDGRLLEVYVNWFQSQSQGRELIGYGNSVAGHDVQIAYDREYVDTKVSNGSKSSEFREIMMISSAGDRRLICYNFVIGNKTETNKLAAVLTQGLRSILGKDGAGLLAVSTVCGRNDSDCAIARESLEMPLAELEGMRKHHE